MFRAIFLRRGFLVRHPCKDVPRLVSRRSADGAGIPMVLPIHLPGSSKAVPSGRDHRVVLDGVTLLAVNGLASVLRAGRFLICLLYTSRYV